MKRAELEELLSPEGLRLLDSLPPYGAASDIVASVGALREAGHPPGLVATVLTQSRLRRKAAGKFGPFADRMLFTEAGLEQATRLPVAAQHAGRFARAGLRRVADLGCGIGGDAMALAALELDVLAVEADEVTAAMASYNLAPFPSAHVELSRAEDVALEGVEGAYLDPARRTSGHTDTRRRTAASDYTPPLEFAWSLAERMPVGVKLGPGLDRESIPRDAEAQWVSVDGRVVELGVWFGPLAREGVRRAALVIDAAGSHELVAPGDADDAPVGELGGVVYEPDGAVIRARLIGDLARSIRGRMLGRGIAYVTADEFIPTPFARGFRVLERLPFAERELKRELRSRGIGTLEIKKRGVDVDPAALRGRLALKGAESGTLLLTRVAGIHTALLVERLD